MERLKIDLKGWKNEVTNDKTFVNVLANTKVAPEVKDDNFRKVIAEFNTDCDTDFIERDNSDDSFYL